MESRRSTQRADETLSPFKYFFIFSYSVRELRDDDFLVFQRFFKKEIGISLYRVYIYDYPEVVTKENVIAR